jgi:hypothetical protein
MGESIEWLPQDLLGFGLVLDQRDPLFAADFRSG